jgi:hypothetical protein
MGIRENFADEEWKNLLSMPYAVSMAVMAAAPSFLGAWSETKAMITEPVNLAASSGSGWSAYYQPRCSQRQEI